MVSTLYWKRYDVLNDVWTASQPIPDATTSGSPSLAYWNMNNRLYCVYPDPDDTTLVSINYDKNAEDWSAPLPTDRPINEYQFNIAAHDKDLCYLRSPAGEPDWDMRLACTADGKNWGDEITAPRSGGVRPAVAVVGTRLHCVHASDQKMWWTHTDDGTRWTPSTVLPDEESQSTCPAATRFNDDVYLFYATESDDLRFRRCDGGAWTDVGAVPEIPADSIVPALAGTSRGRLMLVYYRWVNPGTLGWTYYDLTTGQWTAPKSFDDVAGIADVALASYLDGVYCVYPVRQ